MDIEATQAIPLSDYDEETDEEPVKEDKKPVSTSLSMSFTFSLIKYACKIKIKIQYYKCSSL